MKQLLEKFNFELLQAFSFSCTWKKEASPCWYNIVTFRHNILYVVNSFVFPLYIPVVIKIVSEMIKILHEKMLNAIYLYWARSIHQNCRKCQKSQKWWKISQKSPNTKPNLMKH